MAKCSVVAIDRTFFALSDPTRREILQRLIDEPGLSVTELNQPLPIKMPGMMKHLTVLAEAGLITRSKIGRTVSVNLSHETMYEAVEWLNQFQRFWATSLDRLTTLVEEDSGI